MSSERLTKRAEERVGFYIAVETGRASSRRSKEKKERPGRRLLASPVVLDGHNGSRADQELGLTQRQK